MDMNKAINEAIRQKIDAIVAYMQTEWRERILSTEPCDRVAALKAVKEFYAFKGQQLPSTIIWCKTPQQMEVERVRLKQESRILDLFMDTPENPGLIKDSDESLLPNLTSVLRLKALNTIGFHLLPEPAALPTMVVEAHVDQGVSDLVNLATRLRVMLHMPTIDNEMLNSDLIGVLELFNTSNHKWLSIWHFTSILHFVLINQEFRHSKWINDWLKIRGVFKHCAGIIATKNYCILLDNPTQLNIQNDMLHCENGPAIAFGDEFKIHAIQGVLVPEKVVINPNLQTLEEIKTEQNSEVKRIRIERFGWERYLSESHAVVLDVRVEAGWMEALMKTRDETVLCVTDPSTGRKFALPVSPDCRRCKDAQRFLLAPESAFEGLGVDIDQIRTYPVLRA